MQKSLLALLGVSSGVFAAQNQNCAPEPPATCYPDDCKSCYCLGPENKQTNAPVRPLTCNGDWEITVAGVYWESHQDGMVYAVANHVMAPVIDSSDGLEPDQSGSGTQAELSNIIDAAYQDPNFKWNFGFKLGLGYNTTCDGWDFGIVWTRYQGKASDDVGAEPTDNISLLPLWSAFNASIGGTLFDTDIQTNWGLDLDLIDVELGREYWVSKMMTVRPFMGIRIAYLDQQYTIQNKGGLFSANAYSSYGQTAVNDKVDINNDFSGAGIRGGLNSVFHLGCGWGIYGDFAASIVYGRFSVDHSEVVREAVSPHDETVILELTERFRASRAMLDLGLGLQWGGLFCDCQYGINISLGWEQHLFFNQNQMWRVNRIGGGGTNSSSDVPEISNDNGENVYSQSRGSLDTTGVTLKVVFDF